MEGFFYFEYSENADLVRFLEIAALYLFSLFTMRPFLPFFLLALGVGTLPACTVNYYVPAGTETATTTPAPRPPRSRPQRYQSQQGTVRWEPAPVVSTPAAPVRPTPSAPTSPPVRTTPPVRTSPPVTASPPVTTGPVRQNPTVRPPVTSPPVTNPPVGTTKPTRPTPATPGAGQPTVSTPMPVVTNPPVTTPPVTTPPVATAGGNLTTVLTEQPAAPTTKPGKALAGQLTLQEEAPVATTGGVKPPKTTSAPGTPTTALAVDEVPVAEPQKEPSIIFTKTPCLGTCPHYTATIYPDGRVSYEGFRYAPVEGKREFRISPSAVNTMLAQAREINFTDLKGSYSDGATDLPSTTATIRQSGGPAKKVSAESGEPAELTSFFRYIEKQITDGLGVTADN